MTAFETVFTAIGGSAVLTGALVFLLRTWIGERVRQSIQHEYAQILERQKAELAAAGAIELANYKAAQEQDRAVRALGEDHLREALRVAHTKRIEAIFTLWDTMVALGKQTPTAVSQTDIIRDDELQKMFVASGCVSALAQLSLESIYQRILSSDTETARARLLAGEVLYSLLDGYRTVIGRASVVLLQGRDAHVLTPWQQDSLVVGVLEKMLTGDALKQFARLPLGRLQWLRNHIEAKFIEAANRIISGEAPAIEAVQQAQAIQAATSAAIGASA